MTKQTITEKILARAAGKPHVRPGETVWVNADILMTHDVCGPGTIAILKQEIGEDAKVWDRDKVVIVPDHYIFTEDADANRNIRTIRQFAADQGLPHFYDPNGADYKGVCHVALAETGHTRPGEVLFGTDSHTCTAGAFGMFATGIGNTDAAFVMGTGKLWVRVPETIRVLFEGSTPAHLTAKDMILSLIGQIGVDGATYSALEFGGAAVDAMEMESRMTLCNMAIEAGAKSGIVPPDNRTMKFIGARTSKELSPLYGDSDASVKQTIRFDVSELEPQVARPHSPSNVTSTSELKGIKVDRCYVGSCTGGKTEDFILAAQILDGNHVTTKTLAVPATRQVEKDLANQQVNGKTLTQILTEAGVEIAPPSCAACLGGPPDTVGRLTGSEVCISTTNRNFPGRMGSKESSVYLASPYTVAASAITGEITDPRRYL